jgi:methylmalonyl-CoA mutase N-terminal domain/subunit
VQRRLDDIKRTAAGTANLLFPIREALRASATVGEVCDAMREVWGVYQPADAY